MQIALWNLLEIMRHYNVWQLARAIEQLVQTDAVGEFHGDDGIVPEERIENYYLPMVRYCRAQCKPIELQAAIVRCDHFEIEMRRPISWSDLGHQARVLSEAIHGELAYRRFAFIPAAKATIHDNVSKDWADVWSKIPSSKEDTERAIDCYALEQNTACVFHLMRVAEMGLRELAKKLRVKIKHKGKICPIEYGDWEKVLTETKNKITQARSRPTGPKRQAILEFYSDAADHCVFMKDIWRNNVSHARKTYNDSEALAVLDRVRDFMRFLAAKV